MATLDELGTYLEGQGIAAQAEGSDPRLMLGSRPDYPDNVLVLSEYPGLGPEYSQQSFMPVAENPSIQVVTRANRYEDAALLANRAWQKLATVTNQTLSGVYYRSIRPKGSPAFMGRDTNDRVLIYFNVAVEKEVSLV